MAFSFMPLNRNEQGKVFGKKVRASLSLCRTFSLQGGPPTSTRRIELLSCYLIRTAHFFVTIFGSTFGVIVGMSDEYEVTKENLDEALDVISKLFAGEDPGEAPTTEENPLLAMFLNSLKDTSIPGYAPGDKLKEEDLVELQAGNVIWIRWAKDNRPDDLRVNGAYEFVRIEGDQFIVHDIEEQIDYWPLHGDTSRGTAHYYSTMADGR